jgi:hypothetical protein
MGKSALLRRLKRKEVAKEEVKSSESPAKEVAPTESTGYYLRDDYCVCDVCARGKHREFFEEGALAFRPIPTPTYLPKFKVRTYQPDGIKLAFDREIERHNAGLVTEWVETRDATGVKATLSVASSHTWPSVIATFQHQSTPCTTYQEAKTQLMATYLKYHGVCVQKYRADAAAQAFDYEAAYSSTPRTEEELAKGKALFHETQQKFEQGHIKKPEKHRIFLNETPLPKVKAPKKKLTAVQKLKIAKGIENAVVLEDVKEEEKVIDIQAIEEMMTEAHKTEHAAESTLSLHQRKFVDPKEDFFHFQTFETWVDTLPLKGETFYVYPELGVQLNPSKLIKKIKEPNTTHWHFSRSLDQVRLEVRKFVAENPITLNPFFTPNGLAADGYTKKANGFHRFCKNKEALYNFVKARHPPEISNHFRVDDTAPLTSIMDPRITGLVDLEQHMLYDQVLMTCKEIWKQIEEAFGRVKEAPFPLPELPKAAVEAF